MQLDYLRQSLFLQCSECTHRNDTPLFFFWRRWLISRSLPLLLLAVFFGLSNKSGPRYTRTCPRIRVSRLHDGDLSFNAEKGIDPHDTR